jgi:hypothetical protein
MSVAQQVLSRREISQLKPSEERSIEQKDRYLMLWAVYAFIGPETARKVIKIISTVQAGTQPDDYEPFLFKDIGTRGSKILTAPIFSTYAQELRAVEKLAVSMNKKSESTIGILKLKYYHWLDEPEIISLMLSRQTKPNKKKTEEKVYQAIYRARSFV